MSIVCCNDIIRRRRVVCDTCATFRFKSCSFSCRIGAGVWVCPTSDQEACHLTRAGITEVCGPHSFPSRTASLVCRTGSSGSGGIRTAAIVANVRSSVVVACSRVIFNGNARIATAACLAGTVARGSCGRVGETVMVADIGARSAPTRKFSQCSTGCDKPNQHQHEHERQKAALHISRRQYSKKHTPPLGEGV